MWYLRVRGTLAVLLGLAPAAIAGPAWAAPAVPAPPSVVRPADGGVHRSAHALGASRAAVRTSTLVCAKVAAKAGFSFTQTVATTAGRQPRIVVAIAVAMAESSCDPRAVNVTSSGSRDRGLWQLNSHYHSEVSDPCAFQIQCNADAAWNVSDQGADWKPWSAFTSGAWKNHLAEARSVISGGFTFLLSNTGTGTCLAADRGDHADGAPVWQWACDSRDSYQQWTVVSAVGSLPVLRDLGTGTCLAWDGAKAGTAQSLSQRTCDAADTGQQFAFLGSGRMNTDGAAQALMQGTHNATCVAADGSSHADGAPVRQRTCDSGDSLQWWN